MNVTCASCQTIFRVDPAKVPTRGVRARCSVCSGVFWVRHPVPATGPAERTAAPGPVSAPAPRPGPPPAEPGPEFRTPPPVPRRGEPSPPSPVEPPKPRSPMPPGPVVAPLASGMPPAPAPTRPAAQPAGPAIPPRPAVGTVSTPPATPRPPADQRPAGPARRAEEVLAEAAAVRPPPPPAQAVVPPPSQPTPAATAAQPKKRRVNPFLSQDPEAKARRLARALISDMVVYHPAKRREGLQHGTLKRLFDDEVKKSWEEYVEQVGKDLAESTSYFYDALNEILADGRPVFP